MHLVSPTPHRFFHVLILTVTTPLRRSAPEVGLDPSELVGSAGLNRDVGRRPNGASIGVPPFGVGGGHGGHRGFLQFLYPLTWLGPLGQAKEAFRKTNGSGSTTSVEGVCPTSRGPSRASGHMTKSTVFPFYYSSSRRRSHAEKSSQVRI